MKAAWLLGNAALITIGLGCGSSEPARDAGTDATVVDGAVTLDAAGVDGSTSMPVPTSRSAFGIFASFAPEFADYERAAGLDHAQYLEWAGQQHDALGAHWTRSNLQLNWDRIEPTLGAGYDWNRSFGTQETFEAAAAAGVHYLAVFFEGGYVDPMLRRPSDHREEYRRFVRDVVERYDGDGIDDAPGGIRITHWQVGNESPSFAALGDGAEVYADWFAITAEAARQADPDAKMVLTAGTVSSAIDELHRAVMTRLAADGVRFDVIDLHHWGGADEIAIESTDEYQMLLASLGLSDVELWSTEHGTYVGQPAPPASDACDPVCAAGQLCIRIGPMPMCVPRCMSDVVCPPPAPTCNRDTGYCMTAAQTREEHARSLVQRFVINRDRGVSLILWNNLVSWHDFGGTEGGIYDRMGLVSGGFLEDETAADVGQPRPAWFAFRDLAARTDELWAERLGPVDVGSSSVYVSGYRNRQTGRVGWVAWAVEGEQVVSLDVEGSAVDITSFVTSGDGTPTFQTTVPVTDGSVSVQLGPNPMWIESQP